MKKIYITGISGTGKTTISKELERKGFYSISIDEIPNLCYWINKNTKERVFTEVDLNKDFIDTHDWICDTDYLKELMNNDTDIVFVLGLASHQKEYLDLFDKILLLGIIPNFRGLKTPISALFNIINHLSLGAIVDSRKIELITFCFISLDKPRCILITSLR
jgi:Cdc6-like AAA superfamily ATPase